MYFEKLTREDFKQFLSKGILLDPSGNKLEDVTFTVTRITDYSVIISIDTEVLKDSISIDDFDIYYNECSLFSVNHDNDKFHRFMIKKFGEKYLDDLLRAKCINPDMVKEVYSLPTDWEDK